MMRCPYFMLLAVVSAAVACGRPEPTRAPTPSVAETAARYDLEFIDTALKHHAVAAEMATMTQGRAQRPELKGLATSILEQTNREMLQLRALRDRWYSVAENAYQPDFPGALSMKMDHGSLQREDVANFDLKFLELMIPHQEAMLTMATDAQQKATRAELRQVAAGMMPGLQRDVTRMREWERAWRQ